MEADKEMEHYVLKQAEDFTMLDRAAIRLAAYGLSPESVDLDREGRPTQSRFSVHATAVKKQEKIKVEDK